MIHTKRDKTLPVLIKELDDVFSKWIRHRDLPGGLGRCFICRNRLFFRDAHCGHYINRDQMNVRYDEVNGNTICQTCNCFDDDHREKYRIALIEKYGIDEVKRLELSFRTLRKFTRPELEELIQFYKSENRQRIKA